MKVQNLKSAVSAVIVADRDVNIVVPSIKNFRASVVELIMDRPNKRRQPEKLVDWAIVNFARSVAGLKGKRVNVRLLSQTDREGLFRNERGHFVKLEK